MEIRVDHRKKDAIYLSECHRYESGLATLQLFRSCPESISHGVFKAAVEAYQGTYDSGKNGDRAEIARRKAARAEVTRLLKKIVSYIKSIATDEDIPALLQVGFDVRVSVIRRRKSVAQPA